MLGGFGFRSFDLDEAGLKVHVGPIQPPDLRLGSEPREQAQDDCRENLREETALISTQVAQEFLSLATWKFASAFTDSDIRAYLDEVLPPLCRVFPDAALYRQALDVRAEIGCSFYDGLIVAGALRAFCTKLYTEDLQDGRMVKGLLITNPYPA